MKKENADPKINVQLDSCVTSQGICAFIADVQNTKNAQVKCQKLLSLSQNQISFIQTDSVQTIPFTNFVKDQEKSQINKTSDLFFDNLHFRLIYSLETKEWVCGYCFS